jgi:hypothetical protein
MSIIKRPRFSLNSTHNSLISFLFFFYKNDIRISFVAVYIHTIHVCTVYKLKGDDEEHAPRMWRYIYLVISGQSETLLIFSSYSSSSSCASSCASSSSSSSSF